MREAVEGGTGEPLGADTATKPSLVLNFWGFPIHQKATDRRSKIVQLVRVAAERAVADDLQASRWTPYGQLMKTVLENSPQYEELKSLLQEINAKIQEAFSEQKETLIGD